MKQKEKKQAVRIILVSHGSLAQAILENVEMLMGPQENLAAYGLRRDEGVAEFIGVLRDELLSHGKDRVLFLSDLMNGTPYNALLMLTQEFPGLYHITGMNLALVIGAVTARNNHSDASLDLISERTVAYAQDSIRDVNEVLKEMGL